MQAVLPVVALLLGDDTETVDDVVCGAGGVAVVAGGLVVLVRLVVVVLCGLVCGVRVCA